MPDERREQPEINAAEKLGQDARRDARMLREGQPITQDDIDAVIQATNDYLIQRRLRNKTYTLANLATECGIGRNVLGRILRQSYDADYAPHIRKLDAFLSDQVKREGRYDFASFVKIGVAEKAWGVIATAKRQNTIGVIIAEPGTGKSTIAGAYAAEDPHAVLIRVTEKCGDAHGLAEELCRALSIPDSIAVSFRKRMMALRERMFRNKSMIILIDEAQKLEASGLEVIRDLHDTSDPAQEFCVPFVLFGDHSFYRLILRSRAGQTSPIKSQLTSRMAPIFDASADAAGSGGPGALYSVEDLRRVLRNKQLRVVNEDATRYLCKLANIPGWGGLRLVKRAVGLAYDLSNGQAVDLKMVRGAMSMLIGPGALEEAETVIGFNERPSEKRATA